MQAVRLAVFLALALVAGPGAPRVVPTGGAIRGPGLLEAVPLSGLEAALHEGDLVFRRGSGRWSGLAAGASGEAGYFSHVGLAVREGGRWQVVHSDADDDTGIGGVRSEALADFLGQARGVAIVRPGLDAGAAAAVVAMSRQPRWREVPFDADFRLDDGGAAMYCTEWVQALVLAATGRDIARPRSQVFGREAITVDDLLHGAGAQPVLDHRLPD